VVLGSDLENTMSRIVNDLPSSRRFVDERVERVRSGELEVGGPSGDDAQKVERA
jgi:hypothetical protein